MVFSPVNKVVEHGRYDLKVNGIEFNIHYNAIRSPSLDIIKC